MQTGARSRLWVVGALGVYVTIASLIVLTPSSYSEIVYEIWSRLRMLGLIGFGAGWVEFVANVLMFLPLGFLLTLLFRNHWYGVVLSIVASASVELAQIFIPDRVPSLRDVIANTLGAVVGAAVAWFLVVRKDVRRDVPDDSLGTP